MLSLWKWAPEPPRPKWKRLPNVPKAEFEHQLRTLQLATRQQRRERIEGAVVAAIVYVPVLLVIGLMAWAWTLPLRGGL